MAWPQHVLGGCCGGRCRLQRRILKEKVIISIHHVRIELSVTIVLPGRGET